MTTVHDIAAYVLEQRGPMTAMKLQKLVYYAQAWTLALTGQRAFSESVQAWAQGPVVYELFDRHRRQYVVQGWAFGDSTRIAPGVTRIADGVLAHYGALSAEELSALTHSEAPWKTARAGIPDALPASPEITPAVIEAFYRSQTRPRTLAGF